MNTKAIGRYIQFLRKQKGLSQRELAEDLCVTFQAVSKWETGVSQT
ncbi:MAG: helix-turn-helix transcriptional regulator [Clostridia bacterium]|nr:helix-turn-helix transcriptional regulator [Clostridia bacterium]